jgi:hypothetical protein
MFVGKFIENPASTDPAFLNYTMKINQLYFANVYVGTQGQRMKMLLDTCSSVSMKPIYSLKKYSHRENLYL